MVPVHLNALYLPQEQQVVEAMADFSRQPYFDGKRDVNPDVANVLRSSGGDKRLKPG